MNEQSHETEIAHGHEPEFERLKELVAVHGRSVLAGLAVVMAVFGGITFYRSNTGKNINQASINLATARTAQDLQGIVDRYGATPSAPLALLRLAKTYYTSGNYDLALQKYSEFATAFPEHDMVAVAGMGRTHCIEARSQFVEALEEFAAFARDNPNHFLTPQAIFGQARCLGELGREDEAKAVYEDFVVANPQSGWLPRAEEALTDVKRKIERKAKAAAGIPDKPLALPPLPKQVVE